MRLGDAPVGLFVRGGGLCLKTEYFVNGGVEAYIVSSGERFWGGAETPQELNDVEVTPIDPEELRPKGRWKRVQDSECYWFECSVCGEQPLRRYNHDCFTLYRPFCGARMEDAE